MKTRTALITGAAGFLGRNTARELKQNGFVVTGVGHGSVEEDSANAIGLDVWTEADITVDTLVGLQGKFDLIVHCAGSGSVGYSVSHPMEDFNRTVNTTLAVLEYVRLFNKDAVLVYPSSAAVYGVKNDRPLQEDELLSPVSPYGFHKKIAEELCKSYSDNFALKVSIIRFFSLYGEGLKKQLLWEACEKFSRNEKELMFFGSGEETRDWLSVLDAARLILLLSETSDRFTIINGGSGEAITVRDILEYVSNEYGTHLPIRFNGIIKVGDPKYYRADTTRAESLGWKPSVGWKQGVRDYVLWHQRAGRG